MQIVGQCLGDKRKHEDQVAVEACIATPIPMEREDEDLAQDKHTEARFREELAKRRPTSRSQSGAN